MPSLDTFILSSVPLGTKNGFTSQRHRHAGWSSVDGIDCFRCIPYGLLSAINITCSRINEEGNFVAVDSSCESSSRGAEAP